MLPQAISRNRPQSRRKVVRIGYPRLAVQRFFATVPAGREVVQGPGGSVKAEGLGDGPAHREVAIAKLRLTLPPKSVATSLACEACLWCARKGVKT